MEDKQAFLRALAERLQAEDDQADQLDMMGGSAPVESGQPPTPPTAAAASVQLALPVTVPRQYRSKAWGGTVTEIPLSLSEED
jgi:hypothetical protein